MSKKRVWGIVLLIPLYLVIFASWIASFYAAYTNMQGINWGTPITYTIIILLYITGFLLIHKDNKYK